MTTYETLPSNERFDSQGERVHCEECEQYPATAIRVIASPYEEVALCPVCLEREKQA